MSYKGRIGKYSERKVWVFHQLRHIVIAQIVIDWHIVGTQILVELMRQHRFQYQTSCWTTKRNFSLRITKQPEQWIHDKILNQPMMPWDMPFPFIIMKYLYQIDYVTINVYGEIKWAPYHPQQGSQLTKHHYLEYCCLQDPRKKSEAMFTDLKLQHTCFSHVISQSVTCHAWVQHSVDLLCAKTRKEK